MGSGIGTLLGTLILRQLFENVSTHTASHGRSISTWYGVLHTSPSDTEIASHTNATASSESDLPVASRVGSQERVVAESTRYAQIS
jgi:hypothetical protein